MPSASPELFQRSISELLAHGPEVAEAFKRVGLAGCLGCSMSEFDTLSDAVRSYGLDGDAVRRAIEPLVTKEPPCPRPKKSSKR